MDRKKNDRFATHGMAWIPHTIPMSTLRAFSNRPRSDTRVGGGGGRAIRSDDFGWARRMPRPLRMLCVDAVAADFALFPRSLFDTLSPMNAVYLAETLDTDLPVTVVEHVPVDEYWRRRLDAMPPWPRPIRPPATSSPEPARTTYLNELASRTVEDLEPGREADERPELAVFGRHVTALHVDRLRVAKPLRSSDDPVRADVGAVLGHLVDLRSLNLRFGPAALAVADVDAFGRGLQKLRNLAGLAVTGSRVDATRFDRLSPYLAPCDRLNDLDLSHCRLGCAGAASVARYAGTAVSLRSLVLCDNGVAADGVQSLASMSLARRNNGCPPIELNLDMNNITDTGAKHLASALASGSQPFTKLRIRTCNISEIGGINIVESLAYDHGLRALEIDNNPFTLKVGIALHAALKTNLNIKYLSTQNCEFPDSMAQFFNTVAYYNRHNKRNKLNYVDIESLLVYEEIEEEKSIEDEASVQSTKSKKEDVRNDVSMKMIEH